MQLEDLEADATEDELAAEIAARATSVVAFQRKRPGRQPFPDHLPRERIVVAAPESCACCGSSKLVKPGEDVTETLEVIPRQWKVIQTVRERFSCRACETITQPPAPFHVIPRGHADRTCWRGAAAQHLAEIRQRPARSRRLRLFLRLRRGGRLRRGLVAAP